VAARAAVRGRGGGRGADPLLGLLPVPVLLFSPHRQLIRANSAACGLFSAAMATLIGKPPAAEVATALAACLDAGPDAAARRLLAAIEHPPATLELMLRDGRPLLAHSAATPGGTLLVLHELRPIQPHQAVLAEPPVDISHVMLRDALRGLGGDGARRSQLVAAALAATLEAVPDAIAAVDLDANLIACNRGYAELFQVTADRLVIGRSLDFLLDERRELFADFEQFMRLSRQIIEAPEGGAEGPVSWADGRVFHVRARSLVIGTSRVGRVWSWRDVTAETEAAKRLVRLADHDQLTGLLTRRRFAELAAAETARVRRNGRPFALLVIDLDHFKQANDRGGHLAGDRLLALIAGRLAGALRVIDILGRQGGEEFVVLLPETTLTEALTAAERLRAAVATCMIEAAGRELRCTASIGVAVLDEPALAADDPVQAVFARADEALYRAKAAGRDRVETAAGP
jgi:diguanylate cyclase (GGDEF)-like protein/PAS domain S-box-containing protein